MGSSHTLELFILTHMFRNKIYFCFFHEIKYHSQKNKNKCIQICDFLNIMWTFSSFYKIESIITMNNISYYGIISCTLNKCASPGCWPFRHSTLVVPNSERIQSIEIILRLKNELNFRMKHLMLVSVSLFQYNGEQSSKICLCGMFFIPPRKSSYFLDTCFH